MANAPKGNPGPFMQGYDSIVVLGAQCFSGGLASLTCLGDDVVVGSASHADEPSYNCWDSDDKEYRMKWADKLIKEIEKNPNRDIEDILNDECVQNADEDAMTPPAATSMGGEGVVLGDPNNDQQPARPFHAVLFSGVYGPTQQHKDAYDAAMSEMENALENTLHVPSENIMSMTGGTYAELSQMIKDTWDKMNDNEQFILFIADHGSRCCNFPFEELFPIPGGSGTQIPTPSFMLIDEVDQPRVEITTSFVGAPGPVLFNGLAIGTLTTSVGETLYDLTFPPEILSPADVNNVIEIFVPLGSITYENIALTTGPVAQPDPTTGTPFCFGDGRGTACPCGNTGAVGEGCVHSSGYGMTSEGTNSTSISSDHFTMIAYNCPPNNTGIFYSGTISPGNQLFDGVQCAGGNVRRYSGQTQSDGIADDTNFVAQAGPGYFVPGSTYSFQFWTRDVAAGPSPCGTGANFSPGVQVTMTP